MNLKNNTLKQAVCQLLPIFVFCLLYFSLMGCKALQVLATSQEWSENYTLMAGTTCNDPAMIDGNLETIGETKYLEGASKQSVRGYMGPSEGVVILPEPKSVNKLVIHSQNLQAFDLFALETNGNWKHVQEVKNMTERQLTLNLRIPVYTSGLKIRVEKTSDDDALRRQNIQKIRGVSMFSGHTKALAKISEIEIYGFVQSPVE